MTRKETDRWQSREDVGYSKSPSGSKNIRFTEAVACAEAFGFRLSRIHGSHHIYVHANVPELLNLQDVNGQAMQSDQATPPPY